MLLYLLLALQSKRDDELINVPQFVKQDENLDSFESFVAQTFNDRFLTFGPQPKASMWFSKTRQLSLSFYFQHPVHAEMLMTPLLS